MFEVFLPLTLFDGHCGDIFFLYICFFLSCLVLFSLVNACYIVLNAPELMQHSLVKQSPPHPCPRSRCKRMAATGAQGYAA